MGLITDKEILKLLRGFVEFPESKICKHFVALTLLNLLESKGCSISKDLVKDIVEGEDVKAINYLESAGIV